MGMLYGFGASIVIIGALFKIEHWPGASAMLIVGLGTEALIFFVSAFEPPHRDVDWTLVYPELAGIEDDDLENRKKRVGTNSGDAVSQELDRMLEEAKIGPELIESLGTGFRNLSDHAAKLNNISDASVATNEFVDNIKSASGKVGELSDSYERASEALTGLSVSNDASRDYSESISGLAGKLTELNSVYELQLKAANEHMSASQEAFSGISELMNNLQQSVDSTKQYKENIAELSQNLQALNTVYGNMLSAMNVGAPRHNVQENI